MGHPTVYNKTPFLFEPLFLNDETSKPVLVGILKASFRIQDQSAGPLIPLHEQVALKPAGEFYYPDSPISSYRYEPEAVPPKPLTDIVLIATARPPQVGMTQFDVGIRLGDITQRAVVYGQRVWLKGAGGPRLSVAKPVESLPLTFEHAFGGIDTQTVFEGAPAVEYRNPVGVGFHHRSSDVKIGAALPQIENPTEPIVDYYDTPEPVGFGFTGPNWQPRAKFAGTYDAAWENSRKPWLPTDFNTRFYNGAASGLIVESRLSGQERVRVVNASSVPKLEFNLPGLPNPTLHMQTRTGKRHQEPCELDTIVIDTNDMLLMLTYRASLPVPTGAHDVEKIAIVMQGFDTGEHLRSIS